MPIAELRRIAALAAATSNHLRIEFAALGEDGASFHPAPGEWCAKQVVGHLIEADRRGFTGRVRTILSADRPALDAWDQAGIAAARSDCHRPAADLLDEFATVRREGLALLEELTVDDLARTGIHPDVGEMAVRDLLHEWPFHDRDHLGQILTNVRALLWPDLGASQRFSLQRRAGL
ncbi:MAG: DinB family protein [Actinobacteria bacterium]|nr:DinB family protein [Actinomycetota bacterium]